MVVCEALCGLPWCCGTLDGTFVPIKKPVDYKDTYFCYKKFTAITVLACMDARGIFTYVNAGRPSCFGDSYTNRHNIIYQKVASDEWLAHSPKDYGRMRVMPYACLIQPLLLNTLASSVVKLVSSLQAQLQLQCNPHNESGGACILYSRSMGRWRIMDGRCMLTDPVIARQVAVVCCLPHNVCERHQCTFEPDWLPDEISTIQTMPANLQTTAVIASASSVWEAIAKLIHLLRPASQYAIITHEQNIVATRYYNRGVLAIIIIDIRIIFLLHLMMEI